MADFPFKKKIFYSCKETTFLVTQKLYKPLNFWENIKIHIHFRNCNPCKRFYEQSKIIKNIIEQSNSENPPIITQLDKEQEIFLKNLILKNLNNDE